MPLELVDLDFRRLYREPGSPDLISTKVMEVDVTVRNVGRQPVVVSEASIECRRSAAYPGPTAPVAAHALDAGTGPLDASATYEMSIRDHGDPFIASTRLSQVVDEGATDRFLVRVTVPGECSDKLYEIRFVLGYNADENVRSPPVVLAFPGLPCQGAGGFGDTLADVTCFLDSVSRLRLELKTEAREAGLPQPNWDDPGQASRDLAERRFARMPHGPMVDDLIITDEFWDPRGSVERYLEEVTERDDTLWTYLHQTDRVVELNGLRPHRHLESYRDRLQEHRDTLPTVRGEARKALHDRGM